MRAARVFLALLCVPAVGVAQKVAPASVGELQEMVHRDSNDATLHYQLGLKYAADKQGLKAKEAFLTAVRIDPQFTPAYVGLVRLGSYELWGGILVPGKGRDSVTLMFRRVFQLDPLTEISNTSGYYVPMKWKMTIEHALRLYHQEEYQRSRDEFSALIAKTTDANDPRSVPPIALWYHALTAVRLSQPDSAIPDLLRLQAMVKSVGADTIKRQGERLLVADLLDVLKRDYDYALAYLNQLAGHTSEAIQLYQQVSEEDLALFGPHLQLARIYEATGDWTQAILERRRAMDANPEDPSLVFDLGVTLVKAAVFDEAGTVLRQAVAANPRETRCHYALGIVAERLGQAAEAKQEYTTFLMEAPRRFDEQLADARRRLAALPP